MTNSNSVMTNIKSWFSSNQEQKDYKNNVDASAKRLLLNFDKTKFVFNSALLDTALSTQTKFDMSENNALLKASEDIKRDVAFLGIPQETTPKMLDSLTLKEIYYFSNQSERDLKKNLPSPKKFFGLATLIYFSGWWLKKYWYTNLFLKKIRLISTRFNNFNNNTTNNSSNVVDINKNKQPHMFDAFVYDMFVDLLVNKVWARKDLNNMLTKKDIKEVKEYMLKNDTMFESLNYSSPERKKDFSRFNGKNNAYNVDKLGSNRNPNNFLSGIRKDAEEIFQGKNVTIKHNLSKSDLLRQRTIDNNINGNSSPDPNNIGGPWVSDKSQKNTLMGTWKNLKDISEKNMKEYGVFSTKETPNEKDISDLATAWTKNNKNRFDIKTQHVANDSIKENNLKESQKLALENIRTVCVKDSKKDYDFEQYKTIYDNKFDIKTKNANDSLKKEFKDLAEKKANEDRIHFLKNDIRNLLSELKKSGSEPIIEFTKSTDCNELLDIRRDLTKMVAELETKNNKKD